MKKARWIINRPVSYRGQCADTFATEWEIWNRKKGIWQREYDKGQSFAYITVAQRHCDELERQGIVKYDEVDKLGDGVRITNEDWFWSRQKEQNNG